MSHPTTRDLFDMVLQAEGLSQGKRSMFWYFLTRALSGFAKPGDELVCTSATTESAKEPCGFCTFTDSTRHLVVENRSRGKRGFACLRCVNSFEEAAGRMGAAVLVRFTSASALAVFNTRYPGTFTLSPEEEDEPERWEFCDEFESRDPNELAPEGLGADELDWESMDYE